MGSLLTEAAESVSAFIAFGRSARRTTIRLNRLQRRIFVSIYGPYRPWKKNKRRYGR